MIRSSDTTHATFKFGHVERVWRLEANGAFSRSETFLDDIDNGYFNATPLSNSGGSDVSRTNADFVTGPLGRWYYPTTGTNLAAL